MAQAASTAGDNARFNSCAGLTTSWRISAGNNMVFQTRRNFFVRGKRAGKPAESRRWSRLFEQHCPAVCGLIATPSSLPNMRAVGCTGRPKCKPSASQVQRAALARAAGNPHLRRRNFGGDTRAIKNVGSTRGSTGRVRAETRRYNCSRRRGGSVDGIQSCRLGRCRCRVAPQRVPQ
jgi:hypothetical protein